MAMNDAFLFFARCRADDAFRFRLYGAIDGAAFRTLVSVAGFHFDSHEAENALRSLKLKARDEFEAEEIDELGHWFKLMSEPGSAQGDSSPGCSPADCRSCSLCR
jgi:hypothetical protein